MIYSYIEKGILRRSIEVIQIFLKSEISIDNLTQELEVSHMTVRNDLLYISEQYAPFIDYLYTRSGRVQVHFKKEIELAQILEDLLGESLFLRYLFLTLMEETISARLIANREDISFSFAHKIFIRIQSFIEEEGLEENELKRRMVLICLARYIPLEKLADIFEEKWWKQAMEIAQEMVHSRHIHRLNLKQLTMAIYLYLDRATLCTLNLDCYEFPQQFSLDEWKKRLPTLGLSLEEQDNECFFLALLSYYLCEPTGNSPLLSTHPSTQTQLEQHPNFQRLRELVFTYFPMNFLIFQTHLFYYSLQKFITFERLGFPLFLAFSKPYFPMYIEKQNYASFLSAWQEDKETPPNEDIIFEFFYYLDLLQQYADIHKYIFIVATNKEHFHLIHNILTTMIQTNTITIDHHFYASLEDLPEESRMKNAIVVCDRHIRTSSEERLVPFSLNHLNEDLLEIHRKIYNL